MPSARTSVEPIVVPPGTRTTSLCQEICQKYDRSYRKEAQELVVLLRSKEFESLLTAHDSITDNYLDKKSQDFSERSVDTPDENSTMSLDEPQVADQTIRIVRFSKTPGLPLGVTVEDEDDHLRVARVLNGGIIDKMKLLKVGDIILEVNGVEVTSPKQLQDEVCKAKGIMKLKVVSAAEDQSPGGKQCYMKALFSYDPALDTLLPCKEIGVKFQIGDILNIVDQSDPNWWQAKTVHGGAVGLIPSRELEEKRAAFVRPEADFVHSIGICGTRIARKKKVCAYTAKQNTEFDRAELVLYEEVARVPPSELQRKVLVLVGINGVGRRTLTTRLINSDPRRFATVIRVTSRQPKEGEEQLQTYIFTDKESFEEGIRRNDFLEFGENDGQYYGTTFDSVREVIQSGKMCILDCNVSALKILHSSAEFRPFVIFLAYPGAEGLEQQDAFERQHGYSSRTWNFERMSSIRSSSRRARTLESFASLWEVENTQAVEDSQRLEKLYAPYFDLIVVNEDPDETFRRVAQAIDALYTDYQYVPVSWVL